MTDGGQLLEIAPSGPLQGEVRAPPSKSATHRALLLAALAPGISRLRSPLLAEDTRLTIRALGELGMHIRRDGADLAVTGGGGAFPATRAELHLGNAGTAMRFLTAAVALGKGEYLLDGSPRMRQRPLEGLSDALEALGARVRFPGAHGHPPVIVRGPLIGGETVVAAESSSQFTSALVLVAPCTRLGVALELRGRPVSAPYVDLTVEMMSRFGGPEVLRDRDRVRVPGGVGYRAADVTIEGDASAAAALLAAAAVTGGTVRVDGVDAATLQPDGRFPELLEEMGCRVVREPGAVRVEGPPSRGIRVDLGDSPDLAPSVAAAALFATGPTTITGASHLRIKESDRIGDLAEGLRRLGADVHERSDGLTLNPGPLRGARLDPHRDHRLAMAFAAIGLRVPGVRLEDPGCVGKSFPSFFEALDSLRPR